METAPTPPFLDVATLLERSQPVRRVAWFWYAAGAFALVVLASTYLSRQSAQMQAAVQMLSGLAMIGLVGLMAVMTVLAVRRQRAEQHQVQAAEELVQLRRWPEAAAVLEGLLSRPTRTPQARVQGLIYLASVLARYHRFEDAIAVQDHLLENDLVEGPLAHGMRLGRAMAMLRADHLVDADAAINELRRHVAGGQSAGLALVEMYRDVKTGHPEEAVDLFRRQLPILAQQLGHRVADAFVLAAAGYDRLGWETEAGEAYEKATLLSPAAELDRKYPEVAPLAAKYPAAKDPLEGEGA